MEPTEPKVEDKTILSRIFITESGDLIVTDLWDEVREILSQEESSFEIV